VAELGATRWRAPAKVNLTLHILGRRGDGYHELDSVVAFAGACDWLEFVPGADLSLEVRGPTAMATGASEENLILRAAHALRERVSGLRVGRFQLFKTLPVAAGLGGGSSDAAAALRALARENGLALEDPRVFAAARATGADVPVCLTPRARVMAGVGDRVGPPLGLLALAAVLVNARVAVPTPAVFAAIGLARGADSGWGPSPDPLDGDAITSLARGRNDMQASAEALAPAVTDTIESLSRTEGVRLARMSGSGATCFGLYDDRGSAARAARALRAARPGWWVRGTFLR
jgi:4-diphosphocytidyl-2-C-methyl-D-erythritol kinase